MERFKHSDYASHSLGAQSDSRQGGYFPSTHPLPEVEPEDHSVAVLVRPGEAALSVLIDLS